MAPGTALKSREIPREQWVEFLRIVSGAYHGHRVTIDVGRTGALRRVHHDVALGSMTLRLRTAEADCIGITFSRGGETEIVRRFSAPARLRIYVRPDGGYEALEVKGADEESLWIRLPAKTLPLERRARAAVR
jgi:hypothetical protein